MQGSDGTTKATTLQSLMWPELGICTEADLYLRTSGAVAQSSSRRELRFDSGGKVSFFTWFNVFNLEKWQRECALESFGLRLEGEGVFELSLYLMPRNQSGDRVYCEPVRLDAGTPLEVDLSYLLGEDIATGVLFFDLCALGESKLTNAGWQTQDVAKREPKLALAVTTFRREAEVARTVARFETFRQTSWMKDHVEMIVTDNGQTLDLAPHDGVMVVPNENLGGAGGFTRGLLQARSNGATHCLFMDDDASIHMESLERTWMLLAYASDPATAIAGAMISEQHRWAIWENGALFHSRCQPLHMGTDLRDRWQMVEMEHKATPPVPENFYGGWWYFAFPIDRAEHLAFPFFVRGDDVSFSLANDFNILTLNGVVSFQESFTDKESPQTWYLDLRSHMVHHLSLPKLDVGARSLMKIAVWFFLRNLPRMHYDTLSAINLAVEDVMQGPEFFDRHADMAERRGDLKALTTTETWQDIQAGQSRAPVRDAPPRWSVRLMMKITLNGLFIPGFSRLGRKITLKADKRGHVGYIWGASEITVLNQNEDKFYQVSHNKKRAWQQAWRLFRNLQAFSKGYDKLQADYRAQYEVLTGNAYWQKKLNLDVAGETADRQAAE